MTEHDPDLDTTPIDLCAVHDAAEAIQDVVTKTPLLENQDVNTQLGGRLLIKTENMQRTGAFKIRGAYNRIRQMSADERKRGVITYSSGNHAQGVAMAATVFGTSALIVMPGDAPPAKISSTESLGAQVVTYDRDSESYDDVVARLRAETGRLPVPPSGDTRVHAGAATTALEILDQVAEVNASCDAVLIPCGGGGLTAGTAFVMNALSPGTAVYAVEPDAFDDTKRSLEAGHRVKNPTGRRTICDAIMTPTPNAQTFEINKALLAGALSVSDQAVKDAMLFAYHHYKIVVEPGAAVGLAAVLSGEIDPKGKNIVVVITGGNVDAQRYSQLIAEAGGCTRD